MLCQAPPIGNRAISFAGAFSSIPAFQANIGIGVMYIIGTVLWGLEALWSLLTFQQVHASVLCKAGELLVHLL